MKALPYGDGRAKSSFAVADLPGFPRGKFAYMLPHSWLVSSRVPGCTRSKVIPACLAMFSP